MIGWCIGQRQTRSKVGIVGTPPAWLPIGRPVQRVTLRKVRHLVGRNALRLQTVSLREEVLQRNRGRYLHAVRLVRRPYVFVTQAQRQSQFPADAEGVPYIAGVCVLDER